MKNTKQPEFTVIIPFYNEEKFIIPCIDSLLAQSSPPSQIIAVDNASTDKSAELVEQKFNGLKIKHKLLSETKQGKAHALETGCQHIENEFLLTADADIIYPPQYLKLAAELFTANPQAVAVLGICIESDPDNPNSPENILLRANIAKMAKRFPRKCHAGGAGQMFRTQALEAAGGFNYDRWPYVLMDHEIIHCIHKVGPSVYHPDLYFIHSDRRHDRQRVRWPMWDRILYRYHPAFLGNWFFYKYLARQNEKRGMLQNRLREQPWQKQ